MKSKNYLMGLLVLSPFIQSCNVDFNKIEKKAAMINHYEDVSLKLAKENRELHTETKRLEFELEKSKQDLKYYQAKYGGGETAHGESHGDAHGNAHGNAHGGEHAPAVAHGESHGEAPAHGGGHDSGHGAPTAHGEGHAERSIASVAPSEKPNGKTDYVEFKTYKWHADDMMQIADKEFKSKNYEKAAQFYYSLLKNYPSYKGINDEFYFKAGIAAYETGAHHDWTLSHFEALMKTYPTSQYYRSAKLWVALTNLKLGEKKKFFATVEEFRKKYRNTNEWKILSSYYENIEEKTNE